MLLTLVSADLVADVANALLGVDLGGFGEILEPRFPVAPDEPLIETAIIVAVHATLNEHVPSSYLWVEAINTCLSRSQIGLSHTSMSKY